MEALKQSLKIGAGLAALVAVAVVFLPERPTLLGGEAGAIAAPSGSRTTQNASSLGTHPDDPATQEMAQAATTGAQPTEGQRHLERLRQLRSGAAPSEPAAPAVAAPTPQPEPTSVPPSPPREAATPQPPSAPAGSGLDSLTRPAERPQYRLFRAAEALDSATIRADGETIRLAGIVPVASDARCVDGTLCGTAAREALSRWLAEREVLCAVTPGADQAPCVRGEDDIGGWVVANGWARAEAGSVYAQAEDNARNAGLGIWGAGGL